MPTEQEQRAELRKLALAQHWLSAQEVEDEEEMSYAALQARYADLALRAEALHQQEVQRSLLKREEVQDALELSRQGQVLEEGNPTPSDTRPEMKQRDGLTPEKLGTLLQPKKSRTTILNWMKPNATEPRKIYPHEVFTDERGAQRITPDAFLRLSRALGQDATSLVVTPRHARWFPRQFQMAHILMRMHWLTWMGEPT